MIATVRKWGNSLGIRIPKNILETVRIYENDQVDLLPDGDKITIKKITSSAHQTLEERLVAFYGRPIESIESVPASEEIDWGTAKGDEVW